MASLRELIIKISANSSSFQSEIARASRMGADYHRTMTQGNRQAANATRQSQRALADLNGQLATVRGSALAMAGAFAGAFATGNLIAMADNWNSLNARVKLATTSAQDFSIAQTELMRISQYTGSTFESNASLFSKASSSLREYGYTTKDILSLTEALSTGLQVSGASAADTESTITQLSQALGRGVLRGQDFNSVAQSGGRIMKALADGLGVAQKDLKGLADAGELTNPKIVPALISQLGQLRKEYETMPNSVSAASTRINNAFMQWIGGQNQATGTTAALSGILDGLAKNIDTVALSLGALVSVGAVRYFGGMVSSVGSATAGMVSAYRGEVALASAQVRGTQVATARARAAEYRAQKALAAARGTDGQAAAERRLEATQRGVTRSIAARTAAQGALNNVTGLGSRLMSGALGLVGGFPGLIMAGAAAWYVYNQRQEQAQQTAIAYADSLGSVVEKMRELNQVQLKGALAEAGDSIKAQRDNIDDLTSAQANAKAELLERLKLVKQFSVTQGESNGHTTNAAKLQRKYDKITRDLSDAQTKLGRTIADQAKLQGELNRVTTESEASFNVFKKGLVETFHLSEAAAVGLASTLQVLKELNAEQGKSGASVTPPVDTAKYDDFIKKQQESLALLKVEGVERAKLKAVQDAIKGEALKVDGAGNVVADMKDQKAAIEANAVAEYNLQEQQKERNKTTKAGASVAGDYQQKIASLNKEIQIEGVRLKDGDAAARLFAASMEAGTKWTEAQKKELIARNDVYEKLKQKNEDRSAAISNDPYRQAAETQKRASEQLQRQIADGEIKGAEDIARRKQDIDTAYLQAKAEAAQRYAVSGTAELAGNVDPIQNLENQLAKRQALIESYATAGVVSQSRANQLIVAADREAMEQRYQASLQLYASQGDMQKVAVDMFQATTERASNMLTGLLTGTQTFKEGVTNLFASLTQSIVQNLIDMAAQALVTSSIMQTITGVVGGLAGGIGGAASGVSGAAGSAGTGAMGLSTSWTEYDLGGYTGAGGKYEPAGVVHRGEFVMTKEATERIGVENLYGMMRGYANGGLVSPANPSVSSGVRALTASQPLSPGTLGGGSPLVNVVINIDGNGNADTQATEGWGAFGKQMGSIAAQESQKVINRNLMPGMPIWKAIKG
ncbi:phage tail tape measure protein [Serratia sp. JSRIV002]|uniref:tape measure protein n=1 Tax=Serratia sp. JSRIV002 TaxID=2831894 RepID=UPI001CBDA0C7|nr:tape measure protein [Serratia sp. JSRIV002]UAN49693.1 phage tail tape measure protein [Serratia sp. JSRIV002]